MSSKEQEIIIPGTVPPALHEQYRARYAAATQGSSRLLLFAGDQKIEHLNADFYGSHLPAQVAHPRHLFDIASKARIGAFATHLGLISRYGIFYNNIRYVVKLNSKSNSIPPGSFDPLSKQLTSVSEVMAFQRQTSLSIIGVGYTVYLGSAHEAIMLEQAAQIVYQAHQNGLLAMLWMYPAGQYVQEPKSAAMIAGAAGVATALGADFVKVHIPVDQQGTSDPMALRQAVAAAGNTKVLCAGGASIDPQDFLMQMYRLIHEGGIAGAAIGRNIFQKSLEEAVRFTNALAHILIDNASLESAYVLLK